MKNVLVLMEMTTIELKELLFCISTGSFSFFHSHGCLKCRWNLCCAFLLLEYEKTDVESFKSSQSS